MPRRTVALLTCLALGATIAGCGSSEDDDGAAAAPAPSTAAAQPTTVTDVVEVEDFVFGPQAARVKAGGSVTFKNLDRAPHTATKQEGAGAFDTGTLEQGQSKRIRFRTPGSYEYVCLLHLYMKGTVTVTSK